LSQKVDTHTHTHTHTQREREREKEASGDRTEVYFNRNKAGPHRLINRKTLLN